MAISILIADDHDVIRAGIKNILKDQFEYKVIGEAVNGEEVLEKISNLKPDILLLDISMPKKSGIDIASQIQIISPKTKTIIITVHKSNVYIMKALKSGVKGYLNKENAAEELLPALSSVVAGGMYLTSSISSYLVEKILNKSEEKEETLLTEREGEILRLVAEGKSAKEISEIVFISRRTVENYKNTILKKLGLHKTSELIKYAIKRKIVEIEEY
ncbi:MAG: response regulator transcription factor [Candidatus Omnitrophica bacterium]|nr:response regulator transcription factor [Candidatus Omnitrophota bacterium]